MQSMEYYLGFGVGVVGAILFWILVFFVLKKKGFGEKCEPDERQILARGFAYKVAFYVLLCWNGLGYILYCLDLFRVGWMGDFCFTGLILGAFIYAVICVIKDAYLGMAKKPGRQIILMTVIGGINIVLWGSNGIAEYQKNCSVETFFRYRYNLICGVMVLLIAVIQGIKMWYNHRWED